MDLLCPGNDLQHSSYMQVRNRMRMKGGSSERIKTTLSCADMFGVLRYAGFHST